MKKLIVLLSFTLIGIASAEPRAIGLDMNDVSILLPFSEVPALLDLAPRLSLHHTYEATQADRDLQLSQISDRIPPVRDAIEDFVFVALRIDPCANLLQAAKDPTACESEIRLVWQKVQGQDFADSNIHTLYALTPAELSEVLAKLRNLHQNASVDISGLPLSPHPVIAAEGPDSPYLEGVLAIVHQYATASRLKEVANMVANTETNWTLGHFAIREGTSHFMAIPSLGESEEIDTINRGFTYSTDFGSTFQPHSASKLGKLSAEGLLKDAEYATDLQRELNYFPILSRVVDAFAIENPKLFNPKTVNCSSCHVSAKQKQGYDFVREVAQDKIWKSKYARPNFDYPKSGKGLIDRPEGEGEFLDLESFAVYAYRNTRWNLATPYEPKNTDGLQIFSFMDIQTPSIGARVVNDTAETLDFILQNDL